MFLFSQSLCLLQALFLESFEISITSGTSERRLRAIPFSSMPSLSRPPPLREEEMERATKHARLWGCGDRDAQPSEVGQIDSSDFAALKRDGLLQKDELVGGGLPGKLTESPLAMTGDASGLARQLEQPPLSNPPSLEDLINDMCHARAAAHAAARGAVAQLELETPPCAAAAAAFAAAASAAERKPATTLQALPAPMRRKGKPRNTTPRDSETRAQMQWARNHGTRTLSALRHGELREDLLAGAAAPESVAGEVERLQRLIARFEETAEAASPSCRSPIVQETA